VVSHRAVIVADLVRQVPDVEIDVAHVVGEVRHLEIEVARLVLGVSHLGIDVRPIEFEQQKAPPSRWVLCGANPANHDSLIEDPVMKSTKKTVNVAHIQSLIPAAGLGQADPIPAVGAPGTPKDFTPSTTKSRVRVQPAEDLVTAAPAAAKELASSTTYATDFTAKAPDPQTLATNLAFSAAWSAEYAKAEAWFEYVKEQTRIAWRQTNPQLDKLGGAFKYVRGEDTTITTQYPSTAKLYDVRREPAVKGAAVKASKKAAEGAAKPSGKAKTKALSAAAETTPAPVGSPNAAPPIGEPAESAANGSPAKS
jgi:hypothetical protein